ncbi:MAG: T9SS type A sorting domain-containing protein, partial [Chitinophagaceae bacterium]|nr:T9SS type A sorting domain-containing protein [Chitinophagaceae bacterium]
LPVEYSHTLNNWNPGTYYFRLAQKDHDGKISYSSVIRLEVIGEKIQAQILPNPLSKQGKMVVFSPKKQSFSWTIVDLMGRPLTQTHTSLLESGRNEWSFSMEAFTPGIYLVQFKTAEEQQSIKINKQ